MTSSPYDSEFAGYGSVFDEDGHRRLADAFNELLCPALMVVGRMALTMELYGGDVIGEYARRYAVNVRGRMSSSNVHLVVGHRL